MNVFSTADGQTCIDTIRPDGLSHCYGRDLADIQREYPGAFVTSIEAFCERKAAMQDTPIEWSETTEEKWWEMLEVLPPAAYNGKDFLVGEPCDHHAGSGQPRYEGYRNCGGKFWVSNRPMTRAEFSAELGKPLV